MTLEQALLGCPLGLLHKIAAQHGIATDAATLRAELVHHLAARLAQAAGDGELWRTLGLHERVAVGLVASAAGRRSGDALARRLEARMRAEADVAPADATLSDLVERGILYRVFESESSARGTHYVLPRELLERVPRDLLTGPATSVSPVEASSVRHNDPRLDVFVLASALRRETWNLATRRIVGRAGPSLAQLLGRLRPLVPEIDPLAAKHRWQFWLRLGRRLGWLRGGAWPIPDDEAVGALLAGRSLPLATVWRAHVAETAREDGRRIGGPFERRGEAVNALRAALLDVLADLEANQWYPLSRIHSIIPAELGPAAVSRAGSVAADGVEGFGSREHRGEADVAASWLATSWYWLGLVKWGRDPAGTALLAVTPALHEIAERPGSPASPPELGPCRLEAGRVLVAPLGADLVTLYRAEQYLSFAGGTEERRYTLTAPSFARGIRLGGSHSDAGELLGTLAQAALPAEWVGALGEWAATVDRVRLDARIVLSVEDGSALDKVAEIPQVAAAIHERMGERHASLGAGTLGQTLQALAEAGQVVGVDAGLRLEPQHAERAAALGGDAAELLWVLLGTLERLDAAGLGQLAGADSVRAALESVIPLTTRRVLAERADALADRLVRGRDGAASPRRGRGRMA